MSDSHLSDSLAALRQWEKDTGKPASAQEGNAFMDGFQAGRSDLAAAQEQVARLQGLFWAADVATDNAMRERDASRAAFARHTEAVERFLGDLYATMVDPCAEGEIKAEEMQRVLLDAAVRNRDALHYAHERIARCEERERLSARGQ